MIETQEEEPREDKVALGLTGIKTNRCMWRSVVQFSYNMKRLTIIALFFHNSVASKPMAL
jgi:hypothetical protein